MTYNILNGGLGREQTLLEVLRYVQPDVAVLQEVRNPRLMEDWARSLGMQAVIPGGRSLFRVALLSKFPVVSWRGFRPFPPMPNRFLEAEVKCPSGKRLRL